MAKGRTFVKRKTRRGEKMMRLSSAATFLLGARSKLLAFCDITDIRILLLASFRNFEIDGLCADFHDEEERGPQARPCRAFSRLGTQRVGRGRRVHGLTRSVVRRARMKNMSSNVIARNSNDGDSRARTRRVRHANRDNPLYVTLTESGKLLHFGCDVM